MRPGLQRRLMLALGLLSLLLLVVTATALLTLHYTVNRGLREARLQGEVSQLANDVAVSALLCRGLEKDFLINLESPIERARALRQWRASSQRLAQAIDAYSAASTSADDRRQIELWRAAYHFFVDGFEQATGRVESGKTQSAAEAITLLQPVGENLSTLTDMALATSELKRDLAQATRQKLDRLAAQVMVALGAVGAAAFAFAVAWSVLFPPRLIRPVLVLREAAIRLAGGDLAARADVTSKDELGDLARQFNHMAETSEQRTRELEVLYDRAEAARREAEAAKAQSAEQLTTITSQRALIGDLSVPILPLSETTLVVPLVGELDSERMALAEERVLQAIERTSARFLILDVTAVPVIDSRVADNVMRLVKAIQLLGARAVLVGIRPDVAASLVGLGVDLGGITTQRSLRSGIAYTMKTERRDGEPPADSRGAGGRGQQRA